MTTQLTTFIARWYNRFADWDGVSKIFIIKSKKYGEMPVLLDPDDYERVTKLGKWNVHKVRDFFYVQKRFSAGVVELHRFLMNAPKGKYVDHINHNTLDNRRSNLRIVSNSTNLRNGNLRKNNKSGHPGVSYDKSRNKWYARIKVMYKEIHLGRFPTIDDAVNARKLAEIKYFSV